MKSWGSYIRFMAISATIYNSRSIAAWLSRIKDDDISTDTWSMKFDESYRPVPLIKQVIGYDIGNRSVFTFDKSLNYK